MGQLNKRQDGAYFEPFSSNPITRLTLVLGSPRILQASRMLPPPSRLPRSSTQCAVRLSMGICLSQSVSSPGPLFSRPVRRFDYLSCGHSPMRNALTRMRTGNFLYSHYCDWSCVVGVKPQFHNDLTFLSLKKCQCSIVYWLLRCRCLCGHHYDDHAVRCQVFRSMYGLMARNA